MNGRAIDDGLVAFCELRPRLRCIACRIVGSAAEAEDIVQDVWLRWQATDRSVVRDAPGFLVTTTKRLAINLARSARVRRETCVGSRLPERVDSGGDPGTEAERNESLECAVLLLLEKLRPAERASYVLREAFSYRYRRIAGILHLSEANTRQLVKRARKHIAIGSCGPVSSTERRRLLGAFVAAAREGDLGALEGLFADGA